MQYFCDLEKREAKEVLPGMHIRTFWAKEMLMSIVDIEPRAVIPAHSHSHEQGGTIMSGELEMTIEGETRLLKAGDTYIIPSHVEHSAKAGDAPARVLDVFSPIREEYQY